MSSPYLPTPSYIPYTNWGPYSPNSTGAQQSSMGFNVDYPNVNVNPNSPMENIFAQNRNNINTIGNFLGGQAGSQIPYYQGLQQTQQDAQNSALNNLWQTPGYNQDEASQIGTDYSRYNTSPDQYGQEYLTPGEQEGIRGDPQNPVRGVEQGLAGQGAMLNQYQSMLGSQLGAYGENLGGAASAFGAGTQGGVDRMDSNVNGALGRYQSGIGDAISDYSGGIDSAMGSYGGDIKSSLGSMKSSVRGASAGLGEGLDKAQEKFAGLDAAVYDPSLDFDSQGTEKQLTDQDVQNMRTQAGVSAGNQFRTAEDTLERDAAQAGNTSPAALAAMRERLVTQNAATAGDVENSAEIAAKQAQYERASGIEGQRLGAVQTRQGMRAQASTTEEAAAQAAAGLKGTADIQSELAMGQTGVQALGDLGRTGVQAQSDLGRTGVGAAQAFGQTGVGAQMGMSAQDIAAQEAIGGMGFNAANLAGQANISGVTGYGQFSTNTLAGMTQQQWNAMSQAEQQVATRNAQIAQNRQATQVGQDQTRYSQGVGSQQATSQGQQAVGNARIAGQGAYRSGLATQQGMAQQGNQAAQQTQAGVYGTQTGGLNNNTSGQAAFENGKASFGDQFLGALGSTLGKGIGSAATSGLTPKAEGGMIDHPETVVVGESGPELVVPLGGRYKSKWKPSWASEEAA